MVKEYTREESMKIFGITSYTPSPSRFMGLPITTHNSYTSVDGLWWSAIGSTPSNAFDNAELLLQGKI